MPVRIQFQMGHILYFADVCMFFMGGGSGKFEVPDDDDDDVILKFSQAII